MGRDFGALVGAAHVDDPGFALEGSGGLLLLAMIIMSPSIISMLIFACADGISETPPRTRSSGFAAGGAGCKTAGGGSGRAWGGGGRPYVGVLYGGGGGGCAAGNFGGGGCAASNFGGSSVCGGGGC
ncbi:uncharacterized protein LOC133873218 [Alnus glutinosa]|uniref:uncharacterized protein LOC133873218 n=1 Tax=Alnus glutinosa TaxID=3517 RepID=UPI002D77653C|nr:uncharacterized protein LOC133873218 [Alnus glutinosa]